jgi:hypothetical protein
MRVGPLLRRRRRAAGGYRTLSPAERDEQRAALLVAVRPPAATLCARGCRYRSPSRNGQAISMWSSGFVSAGATSQTSRGGPACTKPCLLIQSWVAS